MPVVSPAWLPSEFTEITSAIMLKAPVSQYLYARMVYMADAQAQLRVDPASFEWVNGRGVPANAGGAPVPDLASMQLMLSDDVRGEVILVADELATQPGSVVKLNRPVFSGGGYTFAQRTIGSGQSMSTTPISLTGEQVPITINRYTGPFASGGSTPQPYGIDRFQAMQSVHSLAMRVGTHLINDRDHLVDAGVASLIDNPASGATLYPGDPNNTLSSDSAAFITNGDRTFDYETILRAVAFLQSQNIPTFADGMYRLIVNPAQSKQLLSDPVYRGEAKYIVNPPRPAQPAARRVGHQHRPSGRGVHEQLQHDRHVDRERGDHQPRRDVRAADRRARARPRRRSHRPLQRRQLRRDREGDVARVRRVRDAQPAVHGRDPLRLIATTRNHRP